MKEIEQGIVIMTRGALLAGLAREDLFEERLKDEKSHRRSLLGQRKSKGQRP